MKRSSQARLARVESCKYSRSEKVGGKQKAEGSRSGLLPSAFCLLPSVTDNLNQNRLTIQSWHFGLQSSVLDIWASNMRAFTQRSPAKVILSSPVSVISTMCAPMKWRDNMR